MTDNTTIEHGSGNAFKDLGFRNPGTEQMRADLAFVIWQIMKLRKLSQSDLARLLGASQADISRLKNGEFSRFSVDRLFRFLRALNQEIEIHIRERGQDGGAEHVIPAC